MPVGAFSGRIFHGIVLDQHVSYSLPEVIEMMTVRFRKDLTTQEADAIFIYLLIDNEHVNQMAERIYDWRQSQSVEDMIEHVFEVSIPGQIKKEKLPFKQFLLLTGNGLEDYAVDPEEVRSIYNSLKNNSGLLTTLYLAIRDRLDKLN